MTRSTTPRRPDHAPVDLGVIRAKCCEEGTCWLWQGAMHTGHPVLRHRGKVVNVRRIIAEEFLYLAVEGKLATARCGNGKCCAPEHVEMVTRRTLQRRTTRRTQHQQRPTRNAKQAAIQRARSVLDWDKVQAIRASDLPGRKLAEQYGVALETVQNVRKYRTWKDYSSPFAGLMP